MKKAVLTVRQVRVILNGATVGPKWARLEVDGKVIATGQIRYIRAKVKKLGFVLAENG